MSGRTEAKPARDIPAAWLGRRVAVLLPGAGELTVGILSDVEQKIADQRTVLYLGGDRLEVINMTTVTVDDLGLLGGAA